MMSFASIPGFFIEKKCVFSTGNKPFGSPGRGCRNPRPRPSRLPSVDRSGLLLRRPRPESQASAFRRRLHSRSNERPSTQGRRSFMAGAVGIEPTTRVLETLVIPLHQAPGRAGNEGTVSRNAPHGKMAALPRKRGFPYAGAVCVSCLPPSSPSWPPSS